MYRRAGYCAPGFKTWSDSIYDQASERHKCKYDCTSGTTGWEEKFKKFGYDFLSD